MLLSHPTVPTTAPYNPALQEPRGTGIKASFPRWSQLNLTTPDLGFLKWAGFFESERGGRTISPACFNMNSWTCKLFYSN